MFNRKDDFMKVLCIGHSSWDVTVPVDDYPIENTKYRYNEKYSAGGGPRCWG